LFEDFGAIDVPEVEESIAEIEENRFKHDNSSDTDKAKQWVYLITFGIFTVAVNLSIAERGIYLL